MSEYNESVVSIDDSDMEVAEGEPDVRGWTVVTSDRRAVGEVEDLLIDPAAMKVRYLTVELNRDVAGDGDQTVRVPVNRVRLSNDAHEVIFDGAEDMFKGATTAAAQQQESSSARNYKGTDQPDEVRVTRSAEELRIGKRRVNAGEVEVRKNVETHRVSEPVTRIREEVDVERHPVNAATTSVGDVHIGDDEIRVPITEEEVVVEKHPVVKEEVVIRKHAVEERDTVEADVREEHIDVKNDTKSRR